MRDVAADTFLNGQSDDDIVRSTFIYFARKNFLLLQKLEIQKGKQYYATQVYDACSI